MGVVKNQHVIVISLMSVMVFLNFLTPVFTSNNDNRAHRHHRRYSHRSTTSNQDLRSLERNETYSQDQDQNELHHLETDSETTKLLTTQRHGSSRMVHRKHEKHQWKEMDTDEASVRIHNDLMSTPIEDTNNDSRTPQENQNKNMSMPSSSGVVEEGKDTNLNVNTLRGVTDNSQNIIVKENSEPSTGNVKPGCRSCMLNRQLESTIPTNTLRQMRLELIKEQILRKLGLTEAPNTTYVVKEPIPEPVALGNILPKRKHTHQKHRDRDMEDFYGKTEQVIVFPEDVIPRCTIHLTSPSACFNFNLPQENHVDEISSAELWVYKLKDEQDGRNQSLSLYDISYNYREIKANFIDAQHDITITGWLKLNLTAEMTRWLKTENLQHLFQIGCETCMMSPSESPVVTLGDQRPFIVINYRSSTQKKRSRRNINCSSSVQECCRETFMVSFAEIGWDSWIIAPTEYNAYFCKGSCGTINGMAHSTARHTTVMQKYINILGVSNKTSEIVPCCTAAKMSAISLVYRDPNPNYFNTTLKYETLPNMVVESCGCL